MGVIQKNLRKCPEGNVQSPHLKCHPHLNTKEDIEGSFRLQRQGRNFIWSWKIKFLVRDSGTKWTH